MSIILKTQSTKTTAIFVFHSYSIYSLACLIVLLLNACDPVEIIDNEPITSKIDYKGLPNTGKILSGEVLTEVYTLDSLSLHQFPIVTQEFVDALANQLKVLRLRKQNLKAVKGNISFTEKKLKETIQILQAAVFSPVSAYIHLQSYKLQGNDELGNVFFTGYFTPVIKASREKTDIYQYPIYKTPENWVGMMPTREEIELESALEGRNLALAYAKDKFEIYLMQVQGSGIFAFQDGTQEYFAYSSTNKHPYRSIGRYMVENGLTTEDRVSLKSLKSFFRRHPEKLDEILNINPSFVFFKKLNSLPMGAGHVPLLPGYSVAVDPKYIPLGSCMIASFPIINYKKRVISHEFRYVLAQDIGGAINGPGHIDYYSGIGETARNYAAALHHYGRLYLLLPYEK